MQEIISILKYLATSNTINFIIMVGILYWIVKKIDINKILDSWINKIKKAIKDSEEQKQQSISNLQKAKEILDGLEQDIERIDKNCDDKINVFKNQITQTTKKSIENINSNIKRTLMIDEKKISNNIVENAAKDSINQAQNDIINLLKTNPDLHNKFIQNSIEELEKVKI